jgi:hypothetical protein
MMTKDEVDAKVAELLNRLADGKTVELAHAEVGVLTDAGMVLSERLREVARGLGRIEHRI